MNAGFHPVPGAEMLGAPARLKGTAEPAPAGWPWSGLHGSREHAELWDRMFGSGVHRRTLTADGPVRAEIDLMLRRRLLPPSLSARFDLHPADRAFVSDSARRVVPVRLLSPITALEAGNLRGGLRIAAGAAAPEAVPGLMRALSRQAGWDCLALPVPAGEAQVWRGAAEAAGMSALLRTSGRYFHGLQNVRPWEEAIAAASRNFRKNMSRAERRMIDAGIRPKVWIGAEEEAGLARLRDIAGKSWKSGPAEGNGVRVPFTLRQEAYLRAFARLPGHEAVIITLEAPSGPVAASLLIRRGDDMQGGVIFHDPAAAELSPGHLMLQETQMLAHRLGVTRIDYNATDPWIAGHSDRVAEWVTLLVFAPTLAGRCYARLARGRDAGLSEVPAESMAETAA